MRRAILPAVVLVVVTSLGTVAVVSQGRGNAPAQRQPLMPDCVTFSVTAPPAALELDPEYRKAVGEAYAAAKLQGLTSAQGYPGNNFNEYWATGIEAYTFSSGRGPETLLQADPRLYELVRQVIPSSRMPGNVYVGRKR